MKTKKIIAALILWVGLVTAAEAQLVVRVRPHAPALKVRPIAPSPRHIWIDGSWAVRGGVYVWSDGYWATPRHGHVWVNGHWKHRRGGWVWVPGHWRRRW
ncbi:MAG: YXWGXW repeat-containing protein [Flavihumibacter sp.]|nr:YXWGXW repeat-containing protein [Flavihumibacter sp.]